MRASLILSLSLLALVLVACSSGSSLRRDGPTATPEPSTEDRGSAGRALRLSGERFQEEVDSFTAEMTMKMSGSKGDLEVDYDYLVEVPDRIFMTMDFSGADPIEALIYGENAYIKVQNWWYTLDVEEQGLDVGATQSEEPQGPVSYSELIEDMEDLERLEDTEEDGRTIMNFAGTLTPEAIRESLGEELFGSDMDSWLDSLTTIDVQVAIDEETLLPIRFSEEIAMEIDGEPLVVDLQMEYTDYNVPVEIPDEPVNAPPFESLPN